MLDFGFWWCLFPAIWREGQKIPSQWDLESNQKATILQPTPISHTTMETTTATKEPVSPKSGGKPILKTSFEFTHQTSSSPGNDDKPKSAPGTPGREKKHLTWDEHAIEEHDQLRGTRMKVRAFAFDIKGWFYLYSLCSLIFCTNLLSSF